MRIYSTVFASCIIGRGKGPQHHSGKGTIDRAEGGDTWGLCHWSEPVPQHELSPTLARNIPAAACRSSQIFAPWKIEENPPMGGGWVVCIMQWVRYFNNRGLLGGRIYIISENGGGRIETHYKGQGGASSSVRGSASSSWKRDGFDGFES